MTAKINVGIGLIVSRQGSEINVTPVERPYSDEFLRAYSDEHLKYEIDMFYAVVELLTTPSLMVSTSSPTIIWGLKNGMVEVFAIHLRNLIDFSYLDIPKQTDVVAADFCESGKWKAARPPISASLKKGRARANKEIAHLTTSRVSGSPVEKNWDPHFLAREITSLLKLFASTASGTAIDGNVSARIARCVST